MLGSGAFFQNAPEMWLVGFRASWACSSAPSKMTVLGPRHQRLQEITLVPYPLAIASLCVRAELIQFAAKALASSRSAAHTFRKVLNPSIGLTCRSRLATARKYDSLVPCLSKCYKYCSRSLRNGLYSCLQCGQSTLHGGYPLPIMVIGFRNALQACI